MSFDKAFKQAVIDIKNGTSRSTNPFSCQSVVIKSTTDDETIYPSSEEMNKWLTNLFSNELKPKELNPQALENMKKNGIVPKKQPLELLLIIVTCSETDVYIGFSIPENMTFERHQFIKELVLNNRHHIETIDTYSIVKCETDFPFKEKDNIYQNAFMYLEKIGLYEPEPDDDIAYTFDD
jgi:hypothetical protein